MVHVRTRYDAERRVVVLSVADNGPGVPADTRQKIFEPVYSSKGHAGTGLGLAVSRKIVQELGGTIELVNPPDGGAEFRVNLPAAPREQPSSGDTQGPTV
jgi:signal transduction histidine kinase